MDLTKALSSVVDKVGGWIEGFIAMLPNLGVAVLVVVAFWLCARLGSRLLRRGLDRINENHQINALLATIARVAIITTGLFVALGLLSLDKTVTSLLAGVGIVGLALGFAFQDIAANFMSGVIMAVRHLFRVGDVIQTGGFTGVVERVELRATVIRQFTGESVIIPNKEVFQNPVINFSRHGVRRVDIPVGVSYGDDLERAAEIARTAVQSVPDRDTTREVEVFFTGFGGSSIDFTLRFWIPFEHQVEYMRARSRAIVAIKAAFDENQVTIPFPIRTLDFSSVGGEKLDEVLPRIGIGQAESVHHTRQ